MGDEDEYKGGPPPHVVHVSLLAEEAINAKWNSLKGSPGNPLHAAGVEGLIEVQNGYRRHYERGSIYHRNYGESYFLDLSTDQRYDQLGGPRGYLGFPVADFEKDPEEPSSGRTKFENGAIYFWPDIGAIEMQDMAVRYVGFHCIGETDEWSASDEPYFWFGVVPTLVEKSKTERTRIYEGVDAGEIRGDLLELYRGSPLGAAISVTLVERDQGDPNKYRPLVQKAVDGAGDKVVAGLAEVPIVGGPLAVLAKVVFVFALPALTDAINELLGTADDVLATVGVGLTPKEMLRLTRVGKQDFHGIQAHVESPLMSGGGASYKAYFEVEVV